MRVDDKNIDMRHTFKNGPQKIVDVGTSLKVEFESYGITKKNKMKEDLIEKFIADPIVSELINRRKEFTLVGGAVVDIMEDRKPKDYDFIELHSSVVEDLDFVCDSRWSGTFKFKGETIQLLKTSTNDFEFRISQSKLHLPTIYGDTTDPVSKLKLTYDEISFENKVLIPIGYKKDTVMRCLYRIPHWRKKGYTLQDVTYYSLLEQIGSSSIQKNSK